MDITLNSLNSLQCAKWFLMHERQRHFDDILSIDKDLAKLTDISLPKEVLMVLGNKFIVPERG